MKDQFKIIELYRVALDETWAVFGACIKRETGLAWLGVYKIITGKTTKPHERTVNKLEAWIERDGEAMKRAIRACVEGRRAESARAAMREYVKTG